MNDSHVAEANRIIAETKAKCCERGETEDGMKRGKCHVFVDQNVCECGEIDLRKERLR